MGCLGWIAEMGRGSIKQPRCDGSRVEKDGGDGCESLLCGPKLVEMGYHLENHNLPDQPERS